MTVLVVDDEEVVRDLAVEMLPRSGYLTRAVASARRALELLEQEPFDLVLSDVVMPEMSGVELLHELRARGHDVPVVLMTGGSQDPERTSGAVEAGAASLLYKPFSHDELRDAVARALRR